MCLHRHDENEEGEASECGGTKLDEEDDKADNHLCGGSHGSMSVRARWN
jgi:hypothetical protein